MTRTTVALLLSMSLCGADVLAGPVSGKRAATTSSNALAGTTWHTVHIDGDALFFLIDELSVRFEKDGRFAARVRFVDRQQVVKTGTYRVVGGTVVVTIDGLGKPKEIQYVRQGSDLIARDKAYDATVRLAPGQMEEEGWFW